MEKYTWVQRSTRQLIPDQEVHHLSAVNITDGTEIFNAEGLFRQTEWGGKAIIGDSIIAA